ncbi:hypothetical protein TBLA_0C05330 [Henningerozyma blattae CBS 6284]|uniref:Uncharacterized protein n=1 Tax=Henningerozyma blattae (strain ATCC 34711 / CBS 6284 / DSM 70876 / NBRC 10599 / NRRL Y-10934 / UCD 77-7) TaxID=1071380 RepID=I2H1S8_HENB6|nr:hypothetical protein TBLA_0C05330 [Tetrapisispora blattae CBS 6284]CCH60330.1 hypothetical protein TBLA_0C05330 [Tetrapisispora blattae CBS 6284]
MLNKIQSSKKNADCSLSLSKLPIPFTNNKICNEGWPPYLLTSRNECIINMRSLKGEIDYLSLIDSWLQYTSNLLREIHANNFAKLIIQNYSYDLEIAIINCAYFYQQHSLNILERAYISEQKDILWSTSGKYLKRGLGLLGYYLENYDILALSTTSFQLCTDLASQFKLVQQIGVLVLSLSKLRSNMYKESKDAVLDIQSQDISTLATNSLLYGKIAIGCKDTALKCSSDNQVINATLIDYLEALSYILISLEEYRKDETGNSIGLLNLAINHLKKINPNLLLDNSILKTTKKRDKFKSIIQTKIPSKNTILPKKNNGGGLLPVLKETLDDLILPLVILLKYRYQTTNNKLTFKEIENDSIKLQALLPRGISPDLQGSKWSLDSGVFKEITIDSEKRQKVDYF